MKIKLLFLVIINAVNLFGCISPEELTNLNLNINPDLKHFSPYYGALLYKSGLLDQIYNSENNSFTSTLVKQIFIYKYNELKINEKNIIIKYLDERDIAEILLWIELSSKKAVSELESLQLKLVDKVLSEHNSKFNKDDVARDFYIFINLIEKANKENIYPRHTLNAILLSLLCKNDYCQAKIKIAGYLAKIRCNLPIYIDPEIKSWESINANNDNQDNKIQNLKTSLDNLFKDN